MKKSSKGPASAPGMSTAGQVAKTFTPVFGKRMGSKRSGGKRGGRRR